MIGSPLFEGSIPRLNGMPVHASPYLLPNHTAIELPRRSKNRSHRMFKKLMRRARENAYAVWTEVLIIRDPISGVNYLVCHPTAYRQLVAQIANGVAA
jgi:hypothetical protein